MRTLRLAEAKERLPELVAGVAAEPVTVLAEGRPAAVLISADALRSLEETVAVLSDPDLAEAVEAARRSTSYADPRAIESELAARADRPAR